MKIVVLGTYDKGKPRNRILISGIKHNCVDIIECNVNIWQNEVDKSQIKGKKKRVVLLMRWAIGYLKLCHRYLSVPKHDVVLIGYLGHFDVLVFWALCKFKGVPVVWDAFLSLYDTIIEDRRLFSPTGLLAKCLYALEWLACRAADMIVLDTKSHAAYFVDKYRIAKKKTQSVWVGAEDLFFSDCLSPMRVSATNHAGRHVNLLFYGQFIPLHGIETIIRAAILLKKAPIKWTIIGKGQEKNTIEYMLRKSPLPKLTWIPWVKYEKLPDYIEKADICLGIFGKSGKAGRVIPNKVFQIIAMGKPLITRSSPAMAEIFDKNQKGVKLVGAGDPIALKNAVVELISELYHLKPDLYPEITKKIDAQTIGAQLINIIRTYLKSKRVPAQ